ncbi:MAG: DegT/DnrJ/EryC1/StrS family aminotransferase [Polaribacter sp.]|uniref:DegT/DnrJ/EryC1/StrS family aminotransferase n=1 Tax=Polaribacter sp. TaxID=1920175 RepID=UPI003263B749
MGKNKIINVTKSFLPPLEEYSGYLKKIWDSNHLTNRGSFVTQLEEKLKNKFKVNHLTLTTNGTLPIQIALKVLTKEASEIITTPFSYIATTSSIKWQKLTPVFVDIHPEYLTIDETKIEAAITSKTTAILATHVFGNPCNVLEIERISKKYNLKVIYDAAHCFDVNYKGKSIFNWGDVSTCSFHATKIFHTGEGGCMISKDETIAKQLFLHHNFGHNGPYNFDSVGINAKMSELQAGLGLSMLKYFEEIKEKRKEIVGYYNKFLNFNGFRTQKLRPETEWNYHYYPLIFDSEKELLILLEKLNQINIYPRRYFYPSLNKVEYIDEGNIMPISEDISSRIVCLPLYVGLSIDELNLIILNINNRTNKL